jgi:hypothetical protein
MLRLIRSWLSLVENGSWFALVELLKTEESGQFPEDLKKKGSQIHDLCRRPAVLVIGDIQEIT